jgi:N-methylhydantoinase A
MTTSHRCHGHLRAPGADPERLGMRRHEVELLNARVKATARREPVALAEIPKASGDASQALKRGRQCLWDIARGYEDTPVYDGSRLVAGHELAGPPVIEERTTTVVVPPGYACLEDSWKNYIRSRRG